MRLFRFKKLSQAGFGLHFVMPVLAIVAVAGIGAYALSATHAATPTCRNYVFPQGTSNVAVPVGYTVNKTQCITYIQDIVNGVDEQNSGGYQTMEQAYDKYYGQKDGEMGGVGSGNYNLLTKTHVMAFQATFDYSVSTSKSGYQPLAITGQVDANTWSALCGVSGGYKGKTSTWAKAAYAAYLAPQSGCTNGWGGAVKENHHGSIGVPVAKTTPAPVAKGTPTSTGTQGTNGGTLTLNEARDDYTSSTSYSSAVCHVISSWSSTQAAENAYPNCYNGGTLTLNEARDDYTSSTSASSAICKVIAAWSTTTAAKAVYPNCYK